MVVCAPSWTGKPRDELSAPASRPHIWTTSRDELGRILPEYGRALNNVVYESFETPIVFIDGNAWQEDRWDGGKVIELSMVRESTRVLQDVVPASTDGDFQAIGTKTAAESEPQGPATGPNLSSTPWSEAVERNGLYVFAPEEEPYTAVRSGRGSPLSTSSGPVVAFTPVANNQLTSAPSSEIRSRAPPEIEALLSSHTTRIPVSIVLCRTATLSPFLLPDNQGCVFLGFFMVADVQIGVKGTSLEVVEGQDRPTTLTRSQNTWRFRFEWVPGGEDLNATTTPSSKPWWVDPAIDARRMTGADSEEAGTPLLHPYTLLPLPFLATPAQSVCSDADVKAPRGWHCTSCGRLNLQQNLCYQRCGSCLTPNGLPAIPVEYVRQVRGTDPIAFPWDRYPASVACTSADAPEGLRRFSYAIDADVVVHHLFTRNRPEVQAEPTRLFSDLQTAVEVPAESGTARFTSNAGAYYSCRFGAAPPARTASQHNQRPFADIPEAVRRAGELMIRRAQLHSAWASANPTIDCVDVCAWRTAGGKKGCKLAAEAAPVVVLCLGADVELTFFHHQSTAADRMAPSAVGGAPPDMDEIPIDVLEESVDESLSALVQGGSIGAETGPSRKAPNVNGQGTRSRAKSAKEVLMVTLVHGDMLVVSGDVLEYSIKRTGMSIVLFGTR
ncbi:hypothetical protein BD413DRAFT_154795 [Trametes elegans]|nr:hypothetical protein BD413DRAFT_154795 [Trametes elegans]